MKTVGFVHMVYFWLRDDLSQADRSLFDAGVRSLLQCETVVGGHIGPPAMTPREVVDNTYDCALLVMFEDQEGHDLYQVDPLHHRFIDDCKDLWSRVQIYDHLVKASK